MKFLADRPAARAACMRRRMFVCAFACALVVALAMTVFMCRRGGVTVTIYATGDIHEHTEYLSRIARFVKERKRRDPNVLLVDAGDRLNKGEPAIMATRGEAIFRLMSMCGYDAAVLGNNDYSYGTARLAELIDRYPGRLLDANCRWPAGGAPSNAAAFVVFERSGVRIGIIGVCSTIKNHRADKALKTRADLATISNLVALLRTNVHLLVVITHMPDKKDWDLGRSVPGIDLIVGGHSHACYRAMLAVPGTGTLIQKSGAQGATLGAVTFRFRGTNMLGRATRIIDLAPAMPEDPAVRAVRAAYLAAWAASNAVPAAAGSPAPASASAEACPIGMTTSKRSH